MEDFVVKAKEFIAHLVFYNGTKLLLALVILFIGWKLIKFACNLLRKLFIKKEVDKSLQDFLLSLITILLKILLILTVMSMIGLEITSFIAILGAAGLAIGMALQGTLQNFAGGIIILILKPFKVGDFIEQGSFSGVVKQIQIFNTVLCTADNKIIILPNTQLATNPLINYTKSQIRRVDIPCGIAYGESVDRARAILLGIAATHPEILKEPDVPTVLVMALSDSSVNLQLRVWVKTDDYWKVYFALNQAIYDKFNEVGIEIPFNQLQVHLTQK